MALDPNQPSQNSTSDPSQIGQGVGALTSLLTGLGGIAAPAAAVANLGLNYGIGWSNRIHEAKNINVGVNSPQVDGMGRPIYNLAADQQRINSIHPQGATVGDYAVGGILGGVPGLALTSILGGAAKRQAARRKSIAVANLRAAQHTFNNQMLQFNNTQLAQQASQDLENPEARMYNVAKATTYQ